MPVCDRCGRVAATVEMRRLPMSTAEKMAHPALLPPRYACKDKLPCEVRQRERRRADGRA